MALTEIIESFSLEVVSLIRSGTSPARIFLAGILSVTSRFHACARTGIDRREKGGSQPAEYPTIISSEPTEAVGKRGRPGRVRSVRVGSGRGAGRSRRGRPGWCWRCCCDWWGSIVNRVSCYMFARWRSDTDFSA